MPVLRFFSSTFSNSTALGEIIFCPSTANKTLTPITDYYSRTATGCAVITHWHAVTWFSAFVLGIGCVLMTTYIGWIVWKGFRATRKGVNDALCENRIGRKLEWARKKSTKREPGKPGSAAETRETKKGEGHEMVDLGGTSMPVYGPDHDFKDDSMKKERQTQITKRSQSVNNRALSSSQRRRQIHREQHASHDYHTHLKKEQETAAAAAAAAAAATADKAMTEPSLQEPTGGHPTSKVHTRFSFEFGDDESLKYQAHHGNDAMLPEEGSEEAQQALVSKEEDKVTEFGSRSSSGLTVARERQVQIPLIVVSQAVD